MSPEAEAEIREIIVSYINRVGWYKATDESLYVLGKLGSTSPYDIDARAGRLLPVARFRVMVLEYLFADDEIFEKEMKKAAKEYLYASKRSAYRSTSHAPGGVRIKRTKGV